MHEARWPHPLAAGAAQNRGVKGGAGIDRGEEPVVDDGIDRVFFDGNCALCDGLVRYLVERDDSGRLFRFAPLGGETFLTLLPAAVRADLPDSVVVLTGDRRLLVRSDAVIQVLHRLGGAAGSVAAILGACPRSIRDGGYDLVARVRRRFRPVGGGTCQLANSPDQFRFEP